jgi:hypothetical protein
MNSGVLTLLAEVINSMLLPGERLTGSQSVLNRYRLIDSSIGPASPAKA